MRSLVFALLLTLSVGVRAATITVCASGCDETTIGDAVTAAGATDIIEIQENRTETISLSKNIAAITSDNRPWTYPQSYCYAV